MFSSGEAVRSEEIRIRAAYARRDGDHRYSWFDLGQVFRIHRCEQRILATLKRSGWVCLEGKTILEVGCGGGYWLRELVKWGAQPEYLTGIDFLTDRLHVARRLCAPAVRLQCASATRLPFRDETFELVLQSTVFTSILDPEIKGQAAAEMLRVLKHDGMILWYDYHVNNPWNPDVRGVKRKEIHRLFPDCRIHLERVTLAPPLARSLAPFSYLACYLLEKFPPLCTHYLGVIRKR